MLIVIDNLIDTATVRRFREQLDAADWRDGRQTAGARAAQVKRNQQLADDDPVAQAIGNEILQVLGRHATFVSAALPHRIHPPKFNRYADGGHYGNHVDNAIMPMPGNRGTFRSDVSATLFLTDPADYEGGELTIETHFGTRQVKLPAGSLVLYPSTSLHRVNPVTRGARVSAFLWLQSMVVEDDQRALLYDLDLAIRALTRDGHASQKESLLRLTGVYHNLVRRWAKI